MSAQHTPGPWVTGLDGAAVFSSTARHLGDRYLVASVYGDDPECKPDAAMAANARLIASAPDLLAACRKALYALKGREHDGFLRDAIAKATGEPA